MVRSAKVVNTTTASDLAITQIEPSEAAEFQWDGYASVSLDFLALDP